MHLLCRHETLSKMVRYAKGLIVGHHCETSFWSHFWNIEYGSCSYIIGKYVVTWYNAPQISLCIVAVNGYFYNDVMQN
jgi:hypothetical protein